jgi:hypothetical protein
MTELGGKRSFALILSNSMNAATPSFCKSWFRAKKCPTEMWDAERARQAHNAGSLYTVLIGDPERPTHFIEVTSRFYGVGFLDDHLREYLSYAFQATETGDLFLSMATFREFDGDGDQVVSGTSYVFSTTGDVDIQRQTFRPRPLKESAATRTDVSALYEPVPRFGCYDALLQQERIAKPA